MQHWICVLTFVVLFSTIVRRVFAIASVTMTRLSTANRPLVFFANGIGDYIMGLPAIRALVSLFPDRLTLVCCSRMNEVFYADLRLRRVVETTILYHEGQRDRTFEFDVDAIVAVVRDCDLFVSLNPWHAECVDELISKLSPANSLGFSELFGEVVPLDFGKHAADLTFDIPKRINPALRFEEFASPPTLSGKAQEVAIRIKEIAGTRFLGDHLDFIALLVGWDSLGLDKGQDRVISCCRLPLALSIGVISIGDLFCGIDSCMLHAADFLRVPGVGLFGPTSPHQFGFRLARHVHIRGGESMADICEDEVLEALETMAEGGSYLRGVAPRER
jgi:hypothetical protein